MAFSRDSVTRASWGGAGKSDQARGLWLLLGGTRSHWRVLSRGETSVLKGSLWLPGGEQTAGDRGKNRATN